MSGSARNKCPAQVSCTGDLLVALLDGDGLPLHKVDQLLPRRRVQRYPHRCLCCAHRTHHTTHKKYISASASVGGLKRRAYVIACRGSRGWGWSCGGRGGGERGKGRGRAALGGRASVCGGAHSVGRGGGDRLKCILEIDTRYLRRQIRLDFVVPRHHLESTACARPIAT